MHHIAIPNNNNNNSLTVKRLMTECKSNENERKTHNIPLYHIKLDPTASMKTSCHSPGASKKYSI